MTQKGIFSSEWQSVLIMEKKYFAPSELIINEDGSAFHLHIKPEQLAEKVILVGDPGRVETVASYFESREDEGENRNSDG